MATRRSPRRRKPAVSIPAARVTPEEQRRLAERMEMIGRLASGLAHDFNNLLTAILGQCHLLLRRLSLEDPTRKAIEEIRDAGNRAAALTHQLLAYSRRQALKPRALDLATVYGIVKRSDGYIWVYSEPGMGSVFKVDLPRVDGEIARDQPSEPSVGSLRGTETVLVVEDDDNVRSLVHELLEMSGWDLARSLASTHPAMKVIYMSGYTDRAVAHEKLRDTGGAYLRKPFTAEALARTVREMLDGPHDGG